MFFLFFFCERGCFFFQFYLNNLPVYTQNLEEKRQQKENEKSVLLDGYKKLTWLAELV